LSNLRRKKVIVELSIIIRMNFIVFLSKNKEEIIERLINIHNKYGTSVNWLICHLGSSCANETIFHLLIHGFKEFIRSLSSGSVQVAATNQSIIHILNYFSNLHPQFVRYLLEQIFQVKIEVNKKVYFF